MTNGLPEISRALPSSPEAEQGLLGSIMIAPTTVLGECMERVTVDFFHLTAHRTIYAVLLEMWIEKQPIDIILLTDRLKKAKQLDNIGGAYFVTKLLDVVSTAANASYYIEILREKYVLRLAISIGTDIASTAYTAGANAKHIQELAQKKLLELVEAGDDRKRGTKRMNEHVLECLDELEQARMTPEYMPGLSTGLESLDRQTGGMRRAAMIGIGGRTTRGKSVIGMQLGTRPAIEEQVPVGIWSGEMPARDLTLRLISSHGSIDGEKLFKTPHLLTTDEQVRAGKAGSMIGKSPIYIDDQTGITMSQLAGKARKMKAEYNIQLFVIDYLQLIRPERRGEEKVDTLTDAGAQIKALAGELEIPIIVLLQLDEKNNIKWCRGISGDVTDYWVIKHGKGAVSWLHIQKQRNGGRDVHAPLTWQKEYFRFRDRVAAVGEVAEDDDLL